MFCLSGMICSVYLERYVLPSTFQQHLYMKYISLSRYDITEFVFPIRLCHNADMTDILDDLSVTTK